MSQAAPWNTEESIREELFSVEEGTGIGLVMSKRVVELMGGVIGVESTVREGSVFWIELVVTAAPQLAVDEAEHTGPAQPQARNGAAPRTLLNVEDNPANLKLVEQLIARRPDMRLLSAVNGNLGIDLARDNQPDVILMDINLPGISGIQTLKILREEPVTAHIPVLALTMQYPAISRKAWRQDASVISPNLSRSTSSWIRWTWH